MFFVKARHQSAVCPHSPPFVVVVVAAGFVLGEGACVRWFSIGTKATSKQLYLLSLSPIHTHALEGTSAVVSELPVTPSSLVCTAEGKYPSAVPAATRRNPGGTCRRHSGGKRGWHLPI